MDWLTIEVFDGATPATAWARAWQDLLTEAAVTGGAAYWDAHEHRWGVVLEFAFPDEERRDAFRRAPVVRGALDAAPGGLALYPHRGGGSGDRRPRRPHPVTASGGAALPRPGPEEDPALPCTAPPEPVPLAG